MPQFGRAGSIAAIAISGVLATALWFSASAVVPALQAEGRLDPRLASLFTSAVQAGFVIGTLASAFLGLPDRYDPKRLFQLAALTGALANAAILLAGPESWATVGLRLITGVCLAGIYPVGMTLVATWARADMGLVVGLLVGAIVLGSASPHLFNGLGGVDWRFTLLASSAAAALSALVIGFAGIGPNRPPAPPFDPRAALAGWRDRALRLANLGYLGHMWELYAVWAWIGLFLLDSFATSMPPDVAATRAAFATFAMIGIGGLGSIAGGLFADRFGRTTLTIIAMAVSGLCCLTIGFLDASPPWLLVSLCLIWGVAIVADSAQFSASVAELSDPTIVGTVLTAQTCLGFLLTMVTIHLVPLLVTHAGWGPAFAFLALGPLAGVIAMLRLRHHPDARKLAGGRR